jgi:hypothetical protein
MQTQGTTQGDQSGVWQEVGDPFGSLGADQEQPEGDCGGPFRKAAISQLDSQIFLTDVCVKPTIRYVARRKNDRAGAEYE